MFKPSTQLTLTYNTWKLMLDNMADAEFESEPQTVEQLKTLTKVLVGSYIDESFKGFSINDDCEQFKTLIDAIKPMVKFAAA